MLPTDPKPSWKLRRRAVFSSLIFGFVTIAYVALFGEANSLNEMLVLGAYSLVGGVVAAYIGGSAYEDVKLWKPIKPNYENQSYRYDQNMDYEYDDTMYDDERNYDVH